MNASTTAEFVAPQLASLTGDRFSDPGWVFERKLDGVRAIAVADGRRTRLWSRNRNDVSASYPEIIDAGRPIVGDVLRR